MGWLYCLWFWITDHATVISAVISAIATGFIAWFTIKLTGATQANIDATTRIGNAALAAELPILLVSDIELSEWTGHGKVGKVAAGGPPPKTGKIRVTFQNYGRSVARLTSFCLEHRVARELPPVPVYGDAAPLPNHLTIEQGKALPLVPLDSQNIHICESDMDRITERSPDLAHLWVYGYLGFRDFRGKAHRTGFCYRWHANKVGLEIEQRTGLHEDGPPDYIYNKYEN